MLRQFSYLTDSVAKSTHATGGVYPPSSFAYTAGRSYRFRIDVNTLRHAYSVYVTPTGGVETPIALNHAFRTEQAISSTLSNFKANQRSGGILNNMRFHRRPRNKRIGTRPRRRARTGQTRHSNATVTSSGAQMDTVMALSSSTQKNAKRLQRLPSIQLELRVQAALRRSPAGFSQAIPRSPELNSRSRNSQSWPEVHRNRECRRSGYRL